MNNTLTHGHAGLSCQLACHCRFTSRYNQQGVVLMGRNRTGTSCSVSCPTAHAPGGRPGGSRTPTCPAVLQMTEDADKRRRQTPASKKILAH